MIRSICIAACLALAGPACAQATADGTVHATSEDIKAQVASMLASMKPDQTFMWKPLLTVGPQIAAIEIWKAPRGPAVHVNEDEYITVVQGTGTLVTGGTMVNPQTTKPGQMDGDSIQGGTSQTLVPGEFVLIPAGTPHWFGIPGEPLVLLGTKIPVTPKP